MSGISSLFSGLFHRCARTHVQGGERTTTPMLPPVQGGERTTTTPATTTPAPVQGGERTTTPTTPRRTRGGEASVITVPPPPRPLARVSGGER